MTPLSEYQHRLGEYRATADRQTALAKSIGNARLIVALIGVSLFWLVFVHRGASPWWLPLPIVTFVVLMIRHDAALRAQRLAERAVRLYQLGLARLDGTWQGKGVSGAEFEPPEHPYAASLDLFGRGSLFELLCTARTRGGEETLAQWLLRGASKEEVAARQGAVKDLQPRVDLREQLALMGEDVRAAVHPEALAGWGGAAPVGLTRVHRAAALMLPLITLTTCGIWVLYGLRIPFLLAILAQVGFSYVMRSRVFQVLGGLEEPARELGLIALLLGRLERESFTAGRLLQLRRSMDADGVPPSRQVARLARLIGLLDLRRNQLFAPVALMLMWGLNCACAIEQWRRQHGPAISQWLKTVGELEALLALAGYAWEHPGDCFPEIVEGPPLLDGENLAHPLLAPGRVVANSIRLDAAQPLIVISGSNMSGKSTMLRTVGVSVVLALAGAPVRAKRLTLTPAAVGASIRVMDSLQEGNSRFFAEITLLRRIVELTKHDPPLLFLLDEVLSGTNSHDRRIGAAGVLQGLVRRGAIGLVTTHDLALTHIADQVQPRGINMHFEDHLEDGRMRFDYTIRPGVVAKSNALELMRSIGLEV
ncbi:hypothetical protein [uncultured Paludibaculum sp.]|uniref:MutS-related protein n=1 Tax=uncultured Paludibaculum sp. TaxID=1765020 RepID=UPI002AAB8338|nr:hypothetical protein [uncultured Paludibaculum sp.]